MIQLILIHIEQNKNLKHKYIILLQTYIISIHYDTNKNQIHICHIDCSCSIAIINIQNKFFEFYGSATDTHILLQYFTLAR